MTLTVSLSTQVYKCVPANLMLGVNPSMYQSPYLTGWGWGGGDGGRNSRNQLNDTETGINSVCTMSYQFLALLL